MRTFAVGPYACYLRVYQPLQAFPRTERAAWQAYVRQAHTNEHRDLAFDEQRDALVNAAARSWLPTMPTETLPHEETRRGYVLTAGGTTHVCPLEIQLRSWLALAEFLESGPRRLVDKVVPVRARERIQADMMRWREKNPDPVVHIQTATWRVPMAWFLPFSRDERELTTTPVPMLRYRTRMVEARRRLNRAYRVLQRTIPDGQAWTRVVELGQWLESFHPHAWVELDYGGLAHLFDSVALAADDSVAETADVFAVLEDGDLARARALHAQLEKRWRALAKTETTS